MGKTIYARLVDRDGVIITESEHETVAEAKRRCVRYLSDRFAADCEASHGAWETEKAEVVVDDDCVWDMFYEGGY